MTTEKNMAKYAAYSSAIERINSALISGFFLEAITIEESILTDRLFRFCRDMGFRGSLERVTLGGEITFLKGKPEKCLKFDLIFIDDLEMFWKNRCKCLHQIAKSEPGTAPENVEDMLKLASTTAQLGKVLIKKASNWAVKYQKSNKENKGE